MLLFLQFELKMQEALVAHCIEGSGYSMNDLLLTGFTKFVKNSSEAAPF